MYQSTPRLEDCFSFCVWIYYINYINVSCRLVRWISWMRSFWSRFLCSPIGFWWGWCAKCSGWTAAGCTRKVENPSFRVGRVWLKIIWVFPKIGVPPKHPKMIIFSRKTHGCWVPPFLETPRQHLNHFVYCLPAAFSLNLCTFGHLVRRWKSRLTH